LKEIFCLGLLSPASKAPQEPAVRGCRVSITVRSSEQARQMSVKVVLLRAGAAMRDQCFSVLFLLKDYLLEQIYPLSCVERSQWFLLSTW